MKTAGIKDSKLQKYETGGISDKKVKKYLGEDITTSQVSDYMKRKNKKAYKTMAAFAGVSLGAVLAYNRARR